MIKVYHPSETVDVPARCVARRKLRCVPRRRAEPQQLTTRGAGGRPPRRAGWDDVPARRLSPEQMDSNRALEAAKALARSERDKTK
jgi:hypothetical protein